MFEQPSPIAPRDPWQVVRHGLRLYASNFDPLWRLFFPLALVAQAVSVVVTLAAIPAGSIVSGGQILSPPGSAGGNLLVAIVGSLVEALIWVVLFGAATRLLATAALGRSESPGEAFSFALARLGPLLWAWILVTLAVFVGFLLLIVPGVYASGALAVVIPVVMVEDLRGGRALSRSRELVRGRWWATLGTSLLASLLFAPAVVLLLALSRGGGTVAAFVIWHATVEFALTVFFGPIGIAAIVAIYVDLRARKEPGTLGVPLAPGASSPPAAPAGDPWF